MLYVTSCISICLILSVNLNSEIVKEHNYIAYITSVIPVVILISTG